MGSINEKFEEFHHSVENDIDIWFLNCEATTIVEFPDNIRASDPLCECRALWRGSGNKVPGPGILDHTHLKDIINTRNNKKSTGADGLKNQMLKVLSPTALRVNSNKF